MSQRILGFPARRGGDVGYRMESGRRARQSASKLREAARLVESTAFEEAGEQPASLVAQLIMLSADLERLAQTVERSLTDH